jgi:hypothetical protein
MVDILIDNYTPITYLVELLAAIAGSIYIYKSKDKITLYFVQYLWLTVIVENLAIYSRFMRNNYDNELFILIKNSSFCTNYWLYNVRAVILIILLGKYYKSLITNNKHKMYVKALSIGFALFSVLYLIFSDSFFTNSIPYGFMIRTLIIAIFVCLYYLSVINSEKILAFYKSKHFYLSTTLLLWSLAITPLFIFSSYYTLNNPNFIYLRQIILICSNIIMYLCFTAVFLTSYFKVK